MSNPLRSETPPDAATSIRLMEKSPHEVVGAPDSEGVAGNEALYAGEKAAGSTAERKTAKQETVKKPEQESRSGQRTNAKLVNKVAGLPTNVPVDGDFDSYREFLLTLSPFATTVNRAKIQLAWIYGEALNAFLASPHYKRGDYTRLLSDIGMSWTKGYYVRMIAERFTLANALERPTYSDLLREMGQVPNREPTRGHERGVGDRNLDAVDPPDDPRGDEDKDDDDGDDKGNGDDKGK